MITPKIAGAERTTAPRAGRRPVLVAFAVAFGLCAVLDLVSEAAGWGGRADLFRTLALPLLMGALLAARPPVTRTVLLVVGALLFSWLGDTVGEVGLVVKIGLFLVAQWFFIAAFWPYRRASVLRRPLAVAGYAALLLVLLGVLIRPAAELALPVLIYGVSLVTMAVLATGLNRWGTIGGLSFMISDTMLGMKQFYDLPAPDLMDFLIMFSYLLAEVLLVFGTVVAARSTRRTGGTTCR